MGKEITEYIPIEGELEDVEREYGSDIEGFTSAELVDLLLCYRDTPEELTDIAWDWGHMAIRIRYRRKETTL